MATTSCLHTSTVWVTAKDCNVQISLFQIIDLVALHWFCIKDDPCYILDNPARTYFGKLFSSKNKMNKYI